MGHIAVIFFESPADSLKNKGDHFIKVDIPVLSLLHKDPGIKPAQLIFCCYKGIGAISDFSVNGCCLVCQDVVCHFIYTCSLQSWHCHNRRVRIKTPDKAEPFFCFHLTDGINFVENNQICLCHLCIQQKFHFLRKVDICFFRHNHPNPFRVHNAGKGHQVEFIFFFSVQLKVHMIQCTDSASRDVRKNHVCTWCFQLVHFVYQVLMLITDACSGNRQGQDTCRHAKLRIYNVACT